MYRARALTLPENTALLSAHPLSMLTLLSPLCYFHPLPIYHLFPVQPLTLFTTKNASLSGRQDPAHQAVPFLPFR